jgi:hypothetical protein
MGSRLHRLAKHLRLHAPLPRRSIHAFGVGAAKTGTTSLAAAFARIGRVAHEPETTLTNELAIRAESGTIAKDEILARLHRRDARMRLSLEVAHPPIHVAAELVEAFPEARFLVTVREPRSWLFSRISFHEFRQTRRWEPYRRHFFRDRPHAFLPAEACLRPSGVAPLRTYLEQYEDHHRRACEHLPTDRTMVVRTDRLDDELPDIARFLGVPSGPWRLVHGNRLARRSPALDRIDPAFVDASIGRWCPGVIRRWFPETAARYASARHPDLDGIEASPGIAGTAGQSFS